MARKGGGDGSRLGKVTGNQATSRATRGADFYQSDYAVLPPLLVAEGRRMPRVLWEPHCGAGALVIPLRNRGYHVMATDLYDRGCPSSQGGIDFLGDLALGPAMVLGGDEFGIIANPPFDDVEAHIERATKLAPWSAFFLRFSFFEGTRAKWFPTVGLRRVHLISDRLPMMHGEHVPLEDRTMKQAGMAFAWFIFEPQRKRRSFYEVRTISWRESAKRRPEAADGSDRPPTPLEPANLFGAENA